MPKPVSGGWHEDLLASRDLTDHEKQGFGFLLAWYETWRMGKRLNPCLESGRRFWQLEG